MVKSDGLNRVFRMWAMSLLLAMSVGIACAQKPVGTTVDRATQITEQAMYTVQSGSNYISVDPEYLPATVIYLPGAPFGPLPVALVMSDTIPAQVIFSYSECKTGWVWELAESADAKIVEIKAHESASLVVIPTISSACTEEIKTTAEDADVCYGESFEWNGQTYSASGTYTQHLKTVQGCDSTVTRKITILPEAVSHENKVMVAGGSYEWNGKIYDAAGDYEYHTTNSRGCDSTAWLHLTVSDKPVYDRTDVVTKCAGETLDWYGQTIVAKENTSSYTHLIEGEDADTLVTLDLKVSPSYQKEENMTFCPGDYIMWNDIRCNEAKDYVANLRTVAGCDSIITLHLTIDPNCQSTYETVYFCAGQNTEHEELEGGVVKRYRAYVYESPTEWDYKEGMIVSGEQNRALVDLHRVEQNLYNHYVGELVPVKTIIWTYCPEGESAYREITAEKEPQWIDAGVVSLTVRFVCGQVFTGDFTTDMAEIEANMTPTKKIENGQVFILRGNAKYNLLGTKIQ